MKAEMATRNPADVRVEKDGCTDFVLHKSQQTIFTGIQKKIVDYTEHRLLRYAASVRDPQQKLVLMAIINDYRAGHIAVAWKRGQPVYIRVTRNG
jgi:hypothetical protein